MRLSALMVVRNEEWVLRASAWVALRWCDEMVILDHGSTDATPDIISDLVRDHPQRVHTIRVRASDGWHEQTHRQMVYATAIAYGATHFAVVDADEIPTGNLLADPTMLRWAIMGDELPEASIASFWMPNLWRSLDQYRPDASNGDVRLGFAYHPELHWRPRENGFHLHARYPMFSRGFYNPAEGWRGGGVMHLQFADWRRHVAKNWWYRMVERIQHPDHRTPAETNALYDWPFVGEEQAPRVDCPSAWWAGIEERRHIRLGEKPWHEDEIERLLSKHGAETFRGLDLGPYTSRLAA